MTDQANSYACMFRNKVGGKWSEWKTERWIPMIEVQKVEHPTTPKGGNDPCPEDDFDLGYLKAVNWVFQNERDYTGRKDVQFKFEPAFFRPYDRFKGDPMTYHCEYVVLETA